MMNRRSIPAFSGSPETRAFWDAAAQGRFLVRRCRACGEAHWYPRSTCPFCQSCETDWEDASGEGIVYSYSLAGKSPDAFVVAYVTLAAGPTILTNLVDCDAADITVGQPVRVVFVPTESGGAVPMFKPAS